MNSFIRVGCWLLLCAVYGTAQAQPAPVSTPVPTSDFARTDSYDEASISPDGTYLALRVPIGKDYGLAVLNLADPKKGGARLTIGQDRSILGYEWVSPTRLVFGVAENFGFATAPGLTGELYSVNADGSDAQFIFSWRGETMRLGTRLGKNVQKNAFGFLIRALPDDPEHVLVASYDFTSVADRQHAVAMRVHVRSGKREIEVGSPINGWVKFAADRQGFVRYVVGSDDHQRPQTYVRTPEQPEWRLLQTGEREGAAIDPVGFSNDNQWVYLNANDRDDRRCLLSQSLVSGELKTLACDPVADLATTVMSFDDNEPVAALFRADMPRLQILDSSSRSAAVMRTLQKAFPGQLALPVSHTRDGNKLIVQVDSDRNPGDFYLVDVSTMKADYLASKRSWIDPDQMAERKAIVVPARDGTPLHGFLTLPKGAAGRKVALVVNPHGGPFGVRDDWEWDLDPQLLASRGYAVLQINYRGSGGYGHGFRNAGKARWDSVMIDDISDAARWTVAQGYADPKRLCIYGGSYGGYAALASAEREPQLYRCAIGYAGVYDLPLLKRDSDISDTTRGRNYIDEFVGATPERLADASPVNHVDRLKAALLIVHGTQDRRAPFTQAKSLRKALEERQYPFEWMEVAGEGHGFYAPENRKAFYDRLLGFLYQNIGSPEPTTPP